MGGGAFSREERAVLEIYSVRRCKVIMPKGDGLLQTGAAMPELWIVRKGGTGRISRPYIYREICQSG
jgi:hypothetical protein